MGLFDLFRKNTVKSVSKGFQQHQSMGNNLSINAPADVLNLLWFFDGPQKNIDASTKEPSGISTLLPLTKGTPEKLGYWPSYELMSPTQRYAYIQWLSDIDRETDIGNVFTFFYGLERFIGTSKYNDAVQMIYRLKLHHINKSFNHYSNVALAYAALLHKSSKPLTYISSSEEDAALLVLSKAAIDKRLTAEEITSASKQFGWSNIHYVKSNHELFVENLKLGLMSLYNHDFYPIPELVGNVQNKEIMLSNVTLDMDTSKVKFDQININFAFQVRMPKVITIPDFSNADPIRLDLYQLLRGAHEKTKADLAKKRARSHVSTLPISNAAKVSKAINPKTGFPMAKESSINRAREAYESVINTPNRESTGNTELNHERQIIDQVLPHFSLGDLYYKEGEWYKAEQEWISVVKLMGALPSEKLAIMYHKQKRYKDEISILTDGLKYSVGNKVYPLSEKQNYSQKITKAVNYLEKHSDQDKSTGYNL